MRYQIRGISVAAAAQSGLVFGLILGVLPSLLNVLVISFFTHNLFVLLNGLNREIIPGINLAEKLGLLETLKMLANVDQPLTYLLIFVAGLAFTGILLSGLTAMSAWIYNRIYSRHGGLDVVLEPIPSATPLQQPGGTLSATPAAAPPLVQTVSPTVSTVPASRPASIPAPPPMATVSGPRLSPVGNPGQVWLITRTPYFIGGAAGVDMYIGGLQPRHARIEFDGQARAYVIYDLSNGQTRVNQRQVVEKNMLKDGFHVQLGAVELVFNS